jgi:hypothetical protein
MTRLQQFFAISAAPVQQAQQFFAAGRAAALRLSPRQRLTNTLWSWGIAIPAGSWALMLVAGTQDAGLSYWDSLALTFVGAMACNGVWAEWRYIRDGVR